MLAIPALILPPTHPASLKPPRAEPYATEKRLTVATQDRLRVVWEATSMHIVGGPAQTSGHPDIIACVTGRFVGIELKQPKKKPTPLQYKRLREWEAAGGLAGWAITLEDVDAILSHVDDPSWRNPQLFRDAA